MFRGQIEKVIKSNIIYLFIVVMIVIYLLEFRLRDKRKYEDQLNMFLSSMRSKGLFNYFKVSYIKSVSVFRNCKNPKFHEARCWKAKQYRGKTCLLQNAFSSSSKFLQVIFRIAYISWLFVINQTPRVLKRIGGHWDWRQVDGDKFICLDHILARDTGPCIIYSFGIANDWEFEDQMDSLGEDWTDS